MKSRKKDFVYIILAALTAIVSFYLLMKFINYDLPYLHPDEGIVTSRITSMFKNKNFELNYFKYPGLCFYYGLILLNFCSSFFDGIDLSYLFRVFYVGTAFLSNIFIFFSLYKIFKNIKVSSAGTILAMTSLFLPQWLYYTGPDLLLYAFGNIILFLIITLLYSNNDDKNIYFYYPLYMIVVGLAVSIKYHGILFSVPLFYLHFTKKYFKNYRYDFILGESLLLIPIVFTICNLYMFADFKKFVNDILFNFSHYEGGHTGLDDPFPILTYINVFFRYEFKLIGLILMLLGLFYFIKKKKYRLLLSTMILPVVTILILGRYQLSLPRNISFCIPFAHLLLASGVVALKEFLDRFIKKYVKVIITVILCFMVIPNLLILNYISGYDASQAAAADYISTEIPEGAVIYTPRFASKNGDYYMPGIDPEKYVITTDKKDIKEGDYYIDTSGRWLRFFQTNHLLLGGDYLYPDQQQAYFDTIEDFDLIKTFPSFSLIYERRFMKSEPYDMRVFSYSHDRYYVGPTIDIYTSNEDFRYDFSQVVLKTEKKGYTVKRNSTLETKISIENQSAAKFSQKKSNGIYPVKIYYEILDQSGKVVQSNEDKLIELEADIDKDSGAQIQIKVPMENLKQTENYTLKIDLVKESLYHFSDLGMKPAEISLHISD